MCTALNFKSKFYYFGRNLDLEYSYHETVSVTPRNYPFRFHTMGTLEHHYAMIGMAYVVNGYPLYYDATNEKGVSMAGLRFTDNICYQGITEGKDNIASFEFIPWILSQCANLEEVKERLDGICLVNLAFSEELPPTPLHWMISYQEKSLVVEAVTDGVHVYENPVNVLTNNPAFPIQCWNLNNYMGLTNQKPENRFVENIGLQVYSLGMGALGLPGDLSSASRFVRAAFVLNHSVCGESEEESVAQFFHVLASVEQQRGCVQVGDTGYEITVYSSCCNADKGIYYYTTYENRQVCGVDMWRENLEGIEVVSYELVKNNQIFLENSSKNNKHVQKVSNA